MQHDVIYGSSRYGSIIVKQLSISKVHAVITYLCVGLPLSETTLPDYLKNLGYRNHIVGKWHLGHYREVYTPLHRGFDSHYGYWGGHQDYYDHTSVQGVILALYLKSPHIIKSTFQDSWGYDMRRNRSVDWSAYGHYTTRLLSDKSCSIIAEHNSSTPLFLYIAHLAVHSANPYAPLQAPEETVSLFTHIKDPQRRRYAGELSGFKFIVTS